jgi:HEAT repeat protein
MPPMNRTMRLIFAAAACGGMWPADGLRAWSADPPATGSAPGQAELMAARGRIRYRGEWRTAQEIELIERHERETAARHAWVARLRQLRRALDRSPGVAEQLREISDAHAVPALLAAIGEEPVFRVRGWYLESLGRIGTPEATTAVITVAVDHPDRETRIAACERLAEGDPAAAVGTIVAALSGPDNRRINRAAEALGYLGDRSAVLPLVSVLETEHVVVVDEGGATSATFTPAGGGLAMGGGAKRRKVRHRNEAVLEALVRLTGQNFEWHAGAWRSWVASQQTPPDFDPRRG